MNKRLLKRHKRQVSREKARVRLSEPDLRTPEQVAAAREASRAVAGHRNDPHTHFSALNNRGHGSPTTTTASKSDA
jgi:hypothetical protein